MYSYTQDVPIRAELYRRIVAELGPDPVTGQLLHLCLERPDGTLFYLDVWQDEASCDRAFDERIHPAVDRAFGGNRPPAEPTVHPCGVLDAQGVPGCRFSAAEHDCRAPGGGRVRRHRRWVPLPTCR